MPFHKIALNLFEKQRGTSEKITCEVLEVSVRNLKTELERSTFNCILDEHKSEVSLSIADTAEKTASIRRIKRTA